MKRSAYPAAVLVTALFALTTPAIAEPVSLACSVPGSAPTLFFSVDTAAGVVTMSMGTFPANVTPSMVSWNVPAANLGGGEVRMATNYVLSRTNGDLSVSGEGFSVGYMCQRGTQPAPLLP